MTWLISYQSRYAQLHAHGVSTNAPIESFAVADKHPAAWFADRLEEFRTLEAAQYEPRKGPQTAYVVDRIYSAIEVPAEAADRLRTLQEGR